MTPLSLVLALLLAQDESRAVEAPFSNLSFSAACERAAAEKKVVMIDFYTTWCGPCKKLDRTTWRDASVTAWLREKTVPLKLDAEKETALAERYRVDSYPTIVLLKPDGTESGRLVGYREPAEFLEDAESILAGKKRIDVAEERSASRPNDCKLRVDRGRERMREGKYADALDDFLFVFDESPRLEPSFAGVRLTFLLGDIFRMGRRHPPALEALRERRAAAEKRLFGPGEARKTDLADVRAISETFGEPVSASSLVLRLAGREDRLPEIRMLLRDCAPQLAAEHRYAEMAKALPNLKAEALKAVEADRAFNMIAEMMEKSVKSDGGADPDVEPDAEKAEQFKNLRNALKKRQPVDTAGPYFEALVGLERGADAAALADFLIAKGSASAEVVPALARHALATGKPAAAILQKGAATLDDAARERLRPLLEALTVEGDESRPATKPAR